MSATRSKSNQPVNQGTMLSSTAPKFGRFNEGSGAGTSMTANASTINSNIQYKFNDYPIDEVSRSVSTGDTVTGNANAVISLEYAAVPKAQHVLGGISWSYSPAPVSGVITIENGSGNIVWKTIVTAAGPGFMMFNPAKEFDVNTAAIVRASAGGAGVSCVLGAIDHWVF